MSWTRKTAHRRAASGIAALAVAGIALAGCTAETAETGGDFDFTGKEVGAMEDYDVDTTFVASEPVEFSMFYRDHPNYPLKEDWRILESLDEDHGVTFDLVSAPLSDWEQRKSLVIGAGDSPEIVSVTYPGQETNFVAGGAILPVSDFTEYMPNFTDKVERWDLGASLDLQRQEDGKFYVLPGLREEVRAQYSFAVRSDIWQELGLSLEPADFDEFRDQLRTVKEAYPDLYPLSDRWSEVNPIESTLNLMAPNFGTAAGWGYGQGTWWDEDAGEFVYTGGTDEYRDLVEYLASLVDEGLMDPESLTQDDDQALQKFGSSQSFAIASNDQEVLRMRTTFEELGETDAEISLIRVPAGPAGDLYPGNSRLQSGIMLSSEAAESEHFLAMLQFIDWLYYSDEGLEFAKWGIEGETFTRDGDTRALVETIDVNGLNPGAPEQLSADYGFHNGVFMLEHGSTDDLDLSMLRPEVIEFVDSMKTKEEAAVPPPAPLNEIEREQASLWQNALRDHVVQNTAAFILGQRPLSEWDDYVAELDQRNAQQYIDLVNGAYERAQANID